MADNIGVVPPMHEHYVDIETSCCSGKTSVPRSTLSPASTSHRDDNTYFVLHR